MKIIREKGKIKVELKWRKEQMLRESA